jgi:hypothetical protein
MEAEPQVVHARHHSIAQRDGELELLGRIPARGERRAPQACQPTSVACGSRAGLAAGARA